MGKDRAMGLKQQLGFPNGTAVGAQGLGGGLALFWRRDVVVDIQNMSKSHIDVVLSTDLLDGQCWRFMGFYGEPRRQFRKES